MINYDLIANKNTPFFVKYHFRMQKGIQNKEKISLFKNYETKANDMTHDS